MARKGYVSLFEKAAAVASAGEKMNANVSPEGRLSPLTMEEERRLDQLEEELPMQTILMFRTMARKEVRLCCCRCGGCDGGTRARNGGCGGCISLLMRLYLRW